MSTATLDRLAVAALKAVVAELEDDHAGAREVLGRLFGGAPSAGSSTPAPGSPALRVEAPEPQPEDDTTARACGEGQRLALALLERHGTPAAVVEAHPALSAATLRSWASGARRPSPVSLATLRAAADAPAPGSPEAADTDAGQGDDEDAGDDPEGA